MRMLTIFFYTLKMNFRERESYLQMMLLPIALIFILGMSLSPLFQPSSIGKTVVAYLNEDKGPVGENFDRFLDNREVASMLAIVNVDNKEEGLRKVEYEEASAFLHLPTGISESSVTGVNKAITVTGHPNYSLRITIVENIVESYVSSVNAVFAMYMMGQPDPVHAYEEGVIRQMPLTASDIMPSSVDYYAVTMLVMIIMYGASYAVSGMKTSYLAAIGRRIKSTPIRASELYAGLVMANVVTVFAQGLVVIAFSHFVFQVNWGNNIGQIVGILFLLVLLAIGLGTAIAMLVRDYILGSRIVDGLVPVFTFIAGGYIPLAIHSGSLISYVQYLSPNYLAQTAMFGTIYGGDSAKTSLMVLGLIIFIMASFVIALVSERRKMA